MSVNRGNTIQFKIDTDATAYSIEIYRLGYYQGDGARKVADVSPSAPLPQNQPACANNPATEIYDCGTWAVSASWAVPATAVSGVYIARLIRSDTGGDSHIPFVVRNDGSNSDVVFQTSDSTWQAYNTYGQSDFYRGLANGRAYKVSYNRPFLTRGDNSGRDFLFSNEYPMLRFLEANGYDTSYISSLDTDQSGKNLNGNATNLLNHKVFLSVGHDEYWSADQRANVEAARDAGVNLAFFSGNEVYWKTRWEPSEDGANSPNRTLVCYKDTWANTQIDPVTSTSTWRDPRFGVGKPENALTGTMYFANDSDLAITVSDSEGKLRLWRNTSLANMPSGTSTELAPHTVGYESDEDVDNGFRPAGLIRLSTTVGPTPQYLQDFGNTVLPGTTTHHLTLYKAQSGALVFGAGTIQWSWALDTSHDGTVSPVDTRMQQATVNVLADMNATATTLIPDLEPATKSTDTQAPTAVITSPSSGPDIAQGTIVTVTGTATDAGGGQVAGVEVSLDAGSSWHPAQGTTNFSYTGAVGGPGSGLIQARAIDDSANIQSVPTILSLDTACPCSIFGNVTPGTQAASDSSAVTLGVKFTSTSSGFVTGLRFFKGAGNTGTHTGALYKADGTQLANVTFIDESATGWQTASFSQAVPVAANATYVAAYTAPNGRYSADQYYFSYQGHGSGQLSAPGGLANLNGVFTTSQGMPTASFNQTNYYVDVVFSSTDSTPLSVYSNTPANTASSVPASVPISATFNRAPDQGTVSFDVKDSAGTSVAGVVAIDQLTATFTPSSALTAGQSYSVAVGASANGAAMTPATWSFTTAKPDGVPGVCPCSIFNDSDVPTVGAADDSASVELGVTFTADTAGQITGVRFYKAAGNNGPHTVSLWNSNGDQLATAPVTGEGATGWQTANFPAAVSVTSGATYIASYRAPVGRYSYTVGGLSSPIDKAPLHTPGSAGRYSYGAGAPLAVSTANYFVDPVFTVQGAPTVAAMNPPDQSTSVPVTTSIEVNFSTAIQQGSASISLASANGSPVAGETVSLPLATTAKFIPATELAPGQQYIVIVKDAKNLGGAVMAQPLTTTFTTSGPQACPCSLLPSLATPAVSDSGDTSPVTLGLSFRPSQDGFLSGLRIYRDQANSGANTGILYSSAGVALATLTFPAAGPGWQSASFDSPVTVNGGTTYVASAFMPNGRYSYTSNFFASPVINDPLTGTAGLFTYGPNASFPTSSYNNGYYFVDVAFSPATVPNSPTGVTAVPDDASATVSWSAPFSGGSPITAYTITPYIGAVPQSPIVVSGSSPATVATVGGLTNGTAYTFRVSATNSLGSSAPSAASNSIVPSPLPSAPIAVTATAGDGSAVVSWTAPASDGGHPITSYTVTPFIGAIAQTSKTVAGAPPGTSTVMTRVGSRHRLHLQGVRNQFVWQWARRRLNCGVSMPLLPARRTVLPRRSPTRGMQSQSPSASDSLPQLMGQLWV